MHLTLDISQATYSRLQAKAAQRGTSVDEYVETVLARELVADDGLQADDDLSRLTSNDDVAEWLAALPIETEPLLDESRGVSVRWVNGTGFEEVDD